MERIRERKHRLPLDSYLGSVTVSFTLCILRRRAIFVDPSIFAPMQTMLNDSLRKHGCDALAYLFMPDHIHLVLQGASPESNLWQCVVSFKQASGYWFRRTRDGVRWQKDFHDHILRKDEDVRKHVRYVLENPVRKGTVTDWKTYPYKGSTVFNFSEW